MAGDIHDANKMRLRCQSTSSGYENDLLEGKLGYGNRRNSYRSPLLTFHEIAPIKFTWKIAISIKVTGFILRKTNLL